MRTPFLKFLNHTCAYIVFLVLIFVACLRGSSANLSANPFLDTACLGVYEAMPDSVVFILILVWVLGK